MFWRLADGEEVPAVDVLKRAREVLAHARSSPLLAKYVGGLQEAVDYAKHHIEVEKFEALVQRAASQARKAKISRPAAYRMLVAALDATELDD
ncbi:hypothetical protein [Sphingosinicella sp. BN140058]|uniref:hypothetical protein n=1 Tax=Sphingosinicella sp. BN140058 TaxID=1892855 RepID=UPI001012FC04|nr:hypothetical protein [Sphingosinicella sp. BN140058]QAY80387.1 hypothetical protein ETR14_27490 [Sphingosinicella sp. BN140058]